MNIALPTYNRLEYLRTSVKSLLSSDLNSDDCIWVYDDASSEPGVKEFLLENECSQFRLSFNKSNLGCDHNVYESMRRTFEQTEDKFIVVTDPDAIYNPGWINFIKRKLKEHEPSVNKIGMLSVFNTENHLEKEKDDLTNQFEVYEDLTLCEKKSAGGLGLAINKDIFEKVDPNVILNHHTHFCWDWQCVLLCKQMKYKILCSKDSYVEHIGLFGRHSPNGIYSDTAKNFLGEGENQSFKDFIL